MKVAGGVTGKLSFLGQIRNGYVPKVFERGMLQYGRPSQY